MTPEEAFAKWLEDECEVPLPLEPGQREIAELSLKEAFEAGWLARAKAERKMQ